MQSNPASFRNLRNGGANLLQGRNRRTKEVVRDARIKNQVDTYMALPTDTRSKLHFLRGIQRHVSRQPDFEAHAAGAADDVNDPENEWAD